MTRTGDFWTKRRAAVQAEQDAETTALSAAQEQEEQARLDALSDEEILAELNLPDPDQLDLGDDIQGFMSQAVPDRLRRRALRRLWRLNPVLANVDGLVDYGEDFTDAATVLEDLQTAYQVGKGMLAHVQDLARQVADPEGDGAEPGEQPVEEPETETIAAAAPPPPTEIAFHNDAEPGGWTGSNDAPDEEDTAPPRPARRMRFEFAADTETMPGQRM